LIDIYLNMISVLKETSDFRENLVEGSSEDLRTLVLPSKFLDALERKDRTDEMDDSARELLDYDLVVFPIILEEEQ
jgi:hypothetical protein